MNKTLSQFALIFMAWLQFSGMARTGEIRHAATGRGQDLAVLNMPSPPAGRIRLTPKEQGWLRAHPHIRMGTLEYPPFVIKNPDGSLDGIAVAFMKMINYRLGTDIRLDCSVSWIVTQQRARDRALDGLYPSVANLNARKTRFLFSDEVFSSNVYVYTSQNNDLPLTSLADLAGRRVGYQQGVAHLTELLQDHPNILTTTFSSINAMLNALLEGKIDAVLGHANIQYALLQKAIQVRLALVVPEPLRPVVFTVRKDWPDLVRILNKAIATIQSEERAAILSKWLIAPEGHLDKLRLTEGERAWLDRHPVVRLGYTPHAEPLLILNQDGTRNGIFPEIFRALEQILGTRFEIVLGEWNPVVDKARNRELDGLLACSASQAKASRLLGTLPVYLTYPIVLTRSDAPFTIRSVNDLEGKRIAYQRETKMLELLLDPLRTTGKMVPELNTLDAIESVLNGNADVAFALSFKSYLIEKHALFGIKVAYFDLSHTTPVVTGIRDDWPELVGIINKGLTRMGRERLRDIQAKWTRIPVKPAKQMEQVNPALTPEEKAFLLAHPVIRVAGDFAWAPVEFIGDNRDYSGLAVDYMRAVESMLDVRFEFQRIPWPTLLERAKAHELDMIGCISRTREREKYLLFTDPYITMPIGIFAGHDVTYIGSLDALNGKRVAAIKNYAIHDFLTANHPEIIVVPVADIQEGLSLVTRGGVFAYIGNMLTTGHMISRRGYTNIRVVGETPYTYAQAFGVNPDLPVLRDILQKALDEVSETEKNRIAKRWISLTYEHGFDYAVVWKILAAAVLVVCAVLYWNRLLNARVKKQTAAIRQDEDWLEALWQINRQRDMTQEELAAYALEEAVRLTKSEFAYLYFFDEETKSISLNAWSAKVAARCAAEKPGHYRLAQAGVWADAIRQRTPVIHNDYDAVSGKKGLPDGHVPIRRHMGVPIILDAKPIAVAGVANKVLPYDEADARRLSLLMTDAWKTIQRKKTEDALRQSEEKHKQAQLLARIGHWELDHETMALSWSEEVYRIFEEDIRKFQPTFDGLIDKVHPEDRALLRQAFSDSVENRTAYDIVHRAVVGGGKVKYLHERCHTSYDAEGRPRRSMGTVQDVTPVQEAELSKKKVEAQLRQAQKMEAIGTLAGGIAHDFNNILSIIIGYCELAKEDIGDPETLANSLNEVLVASDKAKHLVRQILTFSRKTEQKKQALKISSIVKEALKLLRASIPSTVEIKREITSGALVLADSTQVHQIVMNLCTNAYHAMRETGGTLGVTLKDVDILESDFIPALKLPSGRYLKLEVSDTGTGMDEETLGKIFDPYFTTKGIGEGTGLGLAVVHGVVKDHGGFLKVYSEAGKGTVFHVFLPVHQGKKDAAHPMGPQLKTEVNGDETILFVDDDGKIADVATRALQDHGYTVFPFTSGVQALQEFQRQPDRFDLVITDMTMPLLTGTQLGRKLLDVRADIPVILCTGHSELTNREHALSMGIAEYLEKPLSIGMMLHTVRTVLDRPRK